MKSAAQRSSVTLRHASEEIALPPSGPLRLVVVADTHSRPHPASAQHIAAQHPHAILHAGDIGSLEVIDRLAVIAPTFAVRGNIDTHARSMPDSIDIAVRGAEAVLLKILLLHIGVYGPKLRADAARQAKACGAQLVICGHSHVPFLGRDRGLLVFNPGSIGPRRFGLPITFGVLELSPERLDLRHVDCETGAPWSP